MRYVLMPVSYKDEATDEWLVNGYSIFDLHEGKFQSVHVFSAQEASKLALEAEEAHQLKANWPEPHDPEVQNLLISEDFKKTLDGSLGPVYLLHQASETVARKRAGL